MKLESDSKTFPKKNANTERAMYRFGIQRHICVLKFITNNEDRAHSSPIQITDVLHSMWKEYFYFCPALMYA